MGELEETISRSFLTFVMDCVQMVTPNYPKDAMKNTQN